MHRCTRAAGVIGSLAALLLTGCSADEPSRPPDRGQERERAGELAPGVERAVPLLRIPSATGLPGRAHQVRFAADGSGFALLAQCLTACGGPSSGWPARPRRACRRDCPGVGCRRSSTVRGVGAHRASGVGQSPPFVRSASFCIVLASGTSRAARGGAVADEPMVPQSHYCVPCGLRPRVQFASILVTACRAADVLWFGPHLTHQQQQPLSHPVGDRTPYGFAGTNARIASMGAHAFRHEVRNACAAHRDEDTFRSGGGAGICRCEAERRKPLFRDSRTGLATSDSRPSPRKHRTCRPSLYRVDCRPFHHWFRPFQDPCGSRFGVTRLRSISVPAHFLHI